MTDTTDGEIHDVDCLNFVPTDTPDNSAIRDGDLAILMLTKPIDLSLRSTARAACLPSPEDYNNIPLQTPVLYISGWGNVPEFDAPTADTLRFAVLPYIPNEECLNIFDEELNLEGQHFLTDNMMCAGNANKDFCNGDSGGKSFFS